MGTAEVTIGKLDASHVVELVIPRNFESVVRLIISNETNSSNDCVCVHHSQIPEVIAKLQEFYENPERYGK